MPLYDNRIQPFYSLLDTFFSIARMIFQTKFHKTRLIERQHDKCLILGNGPSLLGTLENNLDQLDKYDLMAVNFFASSPEYVKYKPNIYVLCDPAFWFDISSEETISKVNKFYEDITNKTSWHLQLLLPYQASKCKTIVSRLNSNPNISLQYFNKTRYEGYGQFTVYKKQWGMPRAQNVLNAALMLAIYSKYSHIVLAGADNDWISNIWVDENNIVQINDTHFYDYEQARKHAKVFGMSMEESLVSFYYAFHSHKLINQFAHRCCTLIANTNPYSFIDIYPKISKI